jgi:hypothetical protein
MLDNKQSEARDNGGQAQADCDQSLFHAIFQVVVHEALTPTPSICSSAVHQKVAVHGDGG